MASSVATPLERQFGRIAAVTEMTSSSSLGSTSITLQFDLDRDIDAAARDVQAAINAARGYLPANLPSQSQLPQGESGRLADHDSVADLDVAEQGPDVRRRLDGHGADAVADRGVGQVRGRRRRAACGPHRIESDDAEQVRHRPRAGAHGDRRRPTRTRPKGQVSDGNQRWEIGANDQLLKAIDYAPLIVAYRNGAPVRIRDVGAAEDSVEDIRTAGYVNGKPAVMVIIFRQPGANIIDTVDAVRAVLPRVQGRHPAGDRRRRGRSIRRRRSAPRCTTSSGR